MTSAKLNRIIHVVGVIILIAGAIDPLEGSIFIVVGSLMIAVAAYNNKDPQRKIFMITFLLIAVGVCFLFFLSSLGGFGENANLSWWWSLLILPYPVGWVMDVVLILKRTYRKKIQMN
jgi:predicted MFS family arabinose efflux permease